MRHTALLWLMSSLFTPFVAAQESPKPGDMVANSVGMKLAWIPAGEFSMGSPAEEALREGDERRHLVRIAQPFRMSTTEVTQAQWSAVMGPRKCAFEGADRPIDSVSWTDAAAFCQKLSQMEGKTYRLPTEAEWEYACRAGATGAFGGPEKPVDLAWFDDNSGDATHSVGTRRPNAWGLFDLHGNVAEWCGDRYDADYSAPAEGDAAASRGRVTRGGSYASFAAGLRCAARSSAPESYGLKFTGFRVVLEVPEENSLR